MGMHVLIISVGGLSCVIGDVLLRRRFIILRIAFIDCCDYLPNHMLNYVSINVLTVYLMSMKFLF